LIECIVEIQNSFNTEWVYTHKLGWEIWLRARVCYQNDFITAEALKDILLDQATKCEPSDIGSVIKNFVSNLNGSFAIIVKSPALFFMIVDPMRSIPVFYGMKDNTFFVSDDAQQVLGHFENAVPDKLASIEFILSGYVSGKDTIFSEVKQLQAGEGLAFNPVSGVDCQQITEKTIGAGDIFASRREGSDCVEQLEDFLIRAFSRLIDSVEGKTIVVPLSDGYDSRLIVSMLSRLKVENVICFTYAKVGAKILQVAKDVAQKAGYPWLLVPYNKQRWQMCLNDNETQYFIKKAHNLHVLPNLQDFPAVKYLCEQGIVPPDAVFVPGHTPMMYLKGQPDEATLSSVVDAILRKHYTRWDWTLKKTKLMPLLWEEIIKTLPDDFAINNIDEAVLAFEAWELFERQTKFIVNSVRTYEFFGYEWRLPLWDKELVRFWLSLPLSVRGGKLPVKNFLEHQNIKTEFFEKKRLQPRKYLRKIKKNLMVYPNLFYILNKFDLRPSQVSSYWTNPLGFYGVTDLWEFIASYHYNINAHSFLIKKLYTEEYDREFAHALTSYFTRSLPSLIGKS